jgi:hypothetical protein
MKKILFVFLIILGTSFEGLRAGCILCDGSENNNGSCKGDRIKTCVDEIIFLSVKCRVGATNTEQCPPVIGD